MKINGEEYYERSRGPKGTPFRCLSLANQLIWVGNAERYNERVARAAATVPVPTEDEGKLSEPTP